MLPKDFTPDVLADPPMAPPVDESDAEPDKTAEKESQASDSLNEERAEPSPTSPTKPPCEPPKDLPDRPGRDLSALRDRGQEGYGTMLNPSSMGMVSSSSPGFSGGGFFADFSLPAGFF